MVAFLWSVSAQDYIFYTQNIFFNKALFWFIQQQICDAGDYKFCIIWGLATVAQLFD